MPAGAAWTARLLAWARARPIPRVLAPLGLLVVVGAMLAFQYTGLGAARSLGLVARPQRFTMLSFVHPNRLPSTVRPGAPFPLRFAIGNHEGRSHRYDWTITAIRGRRRTELAAGDVAVGPGATRAVGTELILAKGRTAKDRQVQLEVRLVSPPEAIRLRVHA